MAARSGMTRIITRLREMCLVEEDPTQIWEGGINFWSDDHLQAVLDRHRNDFDDVLLTPKPIVVSSSNVYLRYHIPGMYRPEDCERADTDGVFDVVDNTGTAPSGAYTVYYDAGYILFDADTEGTTYYVRGLRRFDLRSAAAEIWQTKAAQRIAYVKVRVGGVSIDEDQEYQHCLAMAKHYRGGAKQKILRRVGYA